VRTKLSLGQSDATGEASTSGFGASNSHIQFRLGGPNGTTMGLANAYKKYHGQSFVNNGPQSYHSADGYNNNYNNNGLSFGAYGSDVNQNRNSMPAVELQPSLPASRFPSTNFRFPNNFASGSDSLSNGNSFPKQSPSHYAPSQNQDMDSFHREQFKYSSNGGYSHASSANSHLNGANFHPSGANSYSNGANIEPHKQNLHGEISHQHKDREDSHSHRQHAHQHGENSHAHRDSYSHKQHAHRHSQNSHLHRDSHSHKQSSHTQGENSRAHMQTSHLNGENRHSFGQFPQNTGSIPQAHASSIGYGGQAQAQTYYPQHSNSGHYQSQQIFSDQHTTRGSPNANNYSPNPRLLPSQDRIYNDPNNWRMDSITKSNNNSRASYSNHRTNSENNNYTDLQNGHSTNYGSQQNGNRQYFPHSTITTTIQSPIMDVHRPTTLSRPTYRPYEYSRQIPATTRRPYYVQQPSTTVLPYYKRGIQTTIMPTQKFASNGNRHDDKTSRANCNVVAFRCTIVLESQGRAKLCRPMAKPENVNNEFVGHEFSLCCC